MTTTYMLMLYIYYVNLNPPYQIINNKIWIRPVAEAEYFSTWVNFTATTFYGGQYVNFLIFHQVVERKYK